MNDIDIGRQKSINDLIERAKEERQRAINTIDFLLTHKVPFVFSNGQAIIDNLTEIAERLEIHFESNSDDLDELKNTCISQLNSLKEQLQNTQLTEEELLTSDVFGNSYRMLEEISNKLDVIPSKILEKNKEAICSGISEKSGIDLVKNKIEKEKVELEKQEMYLKGMLEVTILGRKKKELEERIVQVRNKIQNLDNKLMNIESLGNNNKDEELDDKEDGTIEF